MKHTLNVGRGELKKLNKNKLGYYFYVPKYAEKTEVIFSSGEELQRAREILRRNSRKLVYRDVIEK